jgi:cytochrome c oxidase subunit 3
MTDAESMIEEQFEDMPQQYEASHFGMWVFLATEVLFFGGLFFSYAIYRHFYAADFIIGIKHTLIFYGTLNAGLLLTSGLMMALAVQAASENRIKVVPVLLAGTIVLGLAFLACKGMEYKKDLDDKVLPGAHFDPTLSPHTELFFWFYWAMTGLHAIHMIVGIVLLSVMLWMTLRGKFSAQYYTPLEIVGLYWAFVDIIWIFLYPLLYTLGRSS